MCKKHLSVLNLLVLVIWLLPVFAAAESEGEDNVLALPHPRSAGVDAGRIQNVLNARMRPVLEDGSQEIQGRRLAGEKAPSTLNAIVLMCDFSDSLMLGRHGQVPGDFPPAMQTDRYYAAHDSLYFQHLMGDVEDYFHTVSGGRMSVMATVHPRTVNLPETMGFFGNHPTEGEQQILMASMVVDRLDGEIDFPDYDTVILVHAGAGEETDILGNSPEQIYSTYLDPADFAAAFEDSVLDAPYLPAEGYAPGTGIDRVLILPETEQQDPVGSFDGGFGSLGVYCFEVGLHLGMLSLSDFTPSGRPDSQGIGEFGLMGYGLFVGLGFIPPHPCAYNKYLMGWIDPYEADVMLGRQWELTPSEQPSDPAACARVNISGQEYWLLEYRLQDPNGDRRFTFSNDLNGNGTPDFWDADSENGDGTPTGKFDPATDIRERITDAEWDFAMSENNARGPGELAAGSGVYIWHIDEGVIQESFNAPGNLFNADPARKSVDLEEADRIQDLDSSQPSDYILGGDHDSFRFEDFHVFGPGTLPPTDTAGGASTGIMFDVFTKVCVDSQSVELEWNGFPYWGYEYADRMSFQVKTDIDPGSGPVMVARRDFPAGTDLTGSHVLIAPLEMDAVADQIIVAGHEGEVYVLDGDLNEFLDHDGDPTTLEPFARGAWNGEPAEWNLPPAAGDIDDDGDMEIILTGGAGIFAFNPDASPVVDTVPGVWGLYKDLPGCSLPPVLVPDAFASSPSAAKLSICAVAVDAGESRLEFFRGAEAIRVLTIDLGFVHVPSAPVLAGQFLLTAVADTAGGQHHLLVRDLTPTAIPEDVFQIKIPLAQEPGLFPVTWGWTADSSAQAPVYYAVVVDRFGHGETVFFDDDLNQVRNSVVWDHGVEILSPLSVGGAFVGEENLGRITGSGYWLDGWPQRPRHPMAPVEGPGAGSPLVAEIIGSPHPLDQYIFPTSDGRLFGLGTKGEFLPGWPLGGPALSAGSPALGRLTGDEALDLAAIGTFGRITGTDSTGLRTEFVSTVVLWQDVAREEAVWPMMGGSSLRNGSYDVADWVTLPVTDQGTGLVPGSHYCYPSPLLSGPLHVRGQVRSAARAKAFVYNLEGEEMVSTAWRDVSGVEPFDLEVGLDGVATGIYLCRLVIESEGGSSDHNVVQFAVVR